MYSFAELHCHTDIGSNSRMLDSTVTVNRLIDKALEYKFKGVAITDHESLSAHIDAIKYAKQHTNFKLVLGNEIYLIDEQDYRNTDNFYHFILLALDEEGHKQLRQLSTRAWSRVYTHKRMRRVPTFYKDIEEIVGGNQGHIIGMTACLGGQFAKAVNGEDTVSACSFIGWCKKVFGKDNFYIEMQTGVTQEQIHFNKEVATYCEEYNIKPVITNDVHYLTRDKRKVHEAFLNSKDEERETGDFYESTYLKTPEEMLQRLNYLDTRFVEQAFANTVEIVDRVETYDLHQDVIIPLKQLPTFELNHIFKSFYESYEYINKFAHSPHLQDQFLLYQIEQGFVEKKQALDELRLSRIDVELKQLWLISDKLKQRMSAYYNLGETLIDIMWDDSLGNSLVGVARGSVTGYYICYLIGITQVDPIEHQLPYWRHLVADRPELPDVDIDSQSSQRPIIFQKMREIFGEDKCLNIITFKRETSKAAILTSARGLGIPVETARELAATVPVERGKARTISQCLYGDEENKFEPIKEFINLVGKYDMWLDTILEIENLVSGISSHASGFYIFNKPYTEQNSLMITPAGIKCTCWDMEDSDYCGALKFDFLTIEALDKIRKTLDLLVKYNKIEWQGSLKATYNKYLHPSVLTYDGKTMWDLLGEGQIPDVFQFDTLVGSEAIKKIKPTNVKQLALASSVMRLSGSEDSMSPIDRFVLFKNNPHKWYEEMEQCELSATEIKILEKYLERNYGCSIEQEDVMELCMDKCISNFNIVEANKLRKGIAKKKQALIDDVKALFFKKGKANGTSDNLLNYVWNYCITPQLGYSFSRNHTLPYSVIGLQEMNLAYSYPIVYWNTACLTINAAADSNVDKNNSTNYGKIATAIGDMQTNGVAIALPDINKAEYEFTPDEENNEIIFGLKGINTIGDDIAHSIISNRPYKNFKDFIEKNDIPPASIIVLIKAGAFDNLETVIPRRALMRRYIKDLAKIKVDTKSALDGKNLTPLIKVGIIPEEYERVIQLTNFRKFMFNGKNKCPNNIQRKTWYSTSDPVAIGFFNDRCATELAEGRDYKYDGINLLICKSSFEKLYKTKVQPLKEWITKPETLILYNRTILKNYANEKWSKDCLGNNSKWEMDSLCFYHGRHELDNVSSSYQVKNFNELPEAPVIDEVVSRSNATYTKYQLSNIVGTVLDKNKDKHYITILTPNEVVKCKFYKGAFNHYDKQIAVVVDGKKTVVEKSWFTRGNKLMLTGFRRGNMFYPKRYANSIEQHTVKLITEAINHGEKLLFRLERYDE